ncbi:MAG: hypothetical protein U1F25_06730 [Rubrivivax sp.]
MLREVGFRQAGCVHRDRPRRPALLLGRQREEPASYLQMIKQKRTYGHAAPTVPPARR